MATLSADPQLRSLVAPPVADRSSRVNDSRQVQSAVVILDADVAAACFDLAREHRSSLAAVIPALALAQAGVHIPWQSWHDHALHRCGDARSTRFKLTWPTSVAAAVSLPGMSLAASVYTRVRQWVAASPDGVCHLPMAGYAEITSTQPRLLESEEVDVMPRGAASGLPGAAQISRCWVSPLADGDLPVPLADGSRANLHVRAGRPWDLTVRSAKGGGVDRVLLAEALEDQFGAPFVLSSPAPLLSGDLRMGVDFATDDLAWQDAVARHVLRVPADRPVCLTRLRGTAASAPLVAWASGDAVGRIGSVWCADVRV